MEKSRICLLIQTGFHSVTEVLLYSAVAPAMQTGAFSGKKLQKAKLMNLQGEKLFLIMSLSLLHKTHFKIFLDLL